MVSLPATTGRPPVILIGDQTPDHQQLHPRLRQRCDRPAPVRAHQPPGLVRPLKADIAATDSTSRSIAPSWFQPGLVLGTSAVVLLCLWRGRRLGRLVPEPLPVIVRAVETTKSRGRMYRKSPVTAAVPLPFCSRRRESAWRHTSACPSRLRSAVWRRPLPRSAGGTTKMCFIFWNRLRRMTTRPSWN